MSAEHFPVQFLLLLLCNCRLLIVNQFFPSSRLSAPLFSSFFPSISFCSFLFSRSHLFYSFHVSLYLISRLSYANFSVVITQDSVSTLVLRWVFKFWFETMLELIFIALKEGRLCDYRGMKAEQHFVVVRGDLGLWIAGGGDRAYSVGGWVASEMMFRKKWWDWLHVLRCLLAQ